jgi:hypothetical protein
LWTRGAIFVEHRAVGGFEKFDREHPDIVERLEDPHRQRLGLVDRRPVEPGRHRRQREDAVVMPVEDGIPEQDRAVDAADRQQREFAIEHHPAFEHRRLAADRRPGGGRVVDRADARLALAVIAEAAGLQDRRRADLAIAASSSASLDTARNGAVAAAELFDERLFLAAILGDSPARAAGGHRRDGCQVFAAVRPGHSRTRRSRPGRPRQASSASGIVIAPCIQSAAT